MRYFCLMVLFLFDDMLFLLLVVGPVLAVLSSPLFIKFGGGWQWPESRWYNCYCQSFSSFDIAQLERGLVGITKLIS